MYFGIKVVLQWGRHLDLTYVCPQALNRSMSDQCCSESLPALCSDRRKSNKGDRQEGTRWKYKVDISLHPGKAKQTNKKTQTCLISFQSQLYCKKIKINKKPSSKIRAAGAAWVPGGWVITAESSESHRCCSSQLPLCYANVFTGRI